MMKGDIVVQKTKFNGEVKSEWEGELVKSADSNWRIVLHHPIHHNKFEDGQIAQADHLFVHCLNLVEPLSVLLCFDDAGHFLQAKCDAALPAIQTDQTITFVDLDLDIIVESDFSWWLQDEDTFAQHRVSMGYSEQAIQNAHDGIELAKKLVTSRQFPFNDDFLGKWTKIEQ